MGFWQYLLQWGQLSIQLPSGLLSGLSLVITIVSALFATNKLRIPVQIQPATWRNIWRGAFIVFLVIFISNIAASSYNMYQELANRYTQLSNEMNTYDSKLLVLQKNESIPYDEKEIPIQSNKLYIEIPNSNLTIHDRIFNSCTLFSTNQNYIHFENCKIVNSSLKGTSRIANIPVDKMPSGTVIKFVNCVFDSCWFSDFNVIGTDQEISQYKNDFNIK